MAEYLTQEQRAQFERELAQGGGLTQQQAQQALSEGAQMAQEDMKGQQQNELLSQYGFGSMEEMLEQYERMAGTVAELKRMLNYLLSIEKAERTAAQLDVRHPEYAIRRRIELELAPMREEARTATRNRMIQHQWQDSAHQMHDLEKLLPEIAEYIMRNPKYASEADGLTRAYDAVRSQKYRDEQELLEDSEFVGHLLENEQVKEMLMKAYMQQVRRGGSVPQSVGAFGEAGKTPLTARKPITGMEQAKKRLEAMLGANMQ